MSSQDFYIKKLLKDLGRFADLYNAEVFHGKQILKPEIYTALPNYQIHVVDIRNIEDLELYQTGLQQVFGMLKYNNNKSDFHNYILSNRDAINQLDDDALTAAIGLLGENRRLMKLLSTPERKEKGTMCQAIDELIEDGRLEGKIEGSLEGELRMANLISILLKENRLDLLAQITSNETLRKRLFQEYNL